jgi:hypothetical protein
MEQGGDLLAGLSFATPAVTLQVRFFPELCNSSTEKSPHILRGFLTNRKYQMAI